jgi:hypothetical protein
MAGIHGRRKRAVSTEFIGLSKSSALIAARPLTIRATNRSIVPGIRDHVLKSALRARFAIFRFPIFGGKG